MTSATSSFLLKLFLLLGAFGPLPSIVLYVFFPTGTVLFFNGEPSQTAAFWCSTAASADATISFLCFSALMTNSMEVKQVVLRAFGVYAVFHFGAFWWWSNHADQHPEALANGYPISIAVSLAAAIWWGWIDPPKSNTGSSHYEDIDS
jgi:hypothetical protein